MSSYAISDFLHFSPSMIANLWDVTDRDIDRFTTQFLTLCLKGEHGTYLPYVVPKSRDACKMKLINGCAVVVYGLPMFIQKK